MPTLSFSYRIWKDSDMSGPLPDSADVFGRHFVDHTAAGAGEVIAERLRARGLVALGGLTTRGAVLDLARRLMTITAHRDSDPDGLTALHPSPLRAGGPGSAGFGSGELAVHTEGSSTPRPPRLMLLACARPAISGGQCVLVDGREAYEHLSKCDARAAASLARPRTAFFGSGDGHLGQVITVTGSGRVRIRMRQDDLVRFSPLIQPHLEQWKTALDTHRHVLRLGTGQGYVLDNHRWLHGRRPFRGPRQCWRALGEPAFALPDGFEARHDIAAELTAGGRR
ncbi:hypothetical protein GCM10010400_28940 [Streptomyces aculeolatus]|uniref:TauD/TfdA family dioxygenase n=1 Tax=Streptomyces aculeolatus TaxID=270689 RepID=UPI001CEC5274|nr:TauD/TfdA family dioxygenase [Streptomyces aculeolatus]